MLGYRPPREKTPTALTKIDIRAYPRILAHPRQNKAQGSGDRSRLERGGPFFVWIVVEKASKGRIYGSQGCEAPGPEAAGFTLRLSQRRDGRRVTRFAIFDYSQFPAHPCSARHERQTQPRARTHRRGNADSHFPVAGSHRNRRRHRRRSAHHGRLWNPATLRIRTRRPAPLPRPAPHRRQRTTIPPPRRCGNQPHREKRDYGCASDGTRPHCFDEVVGRRFSLPQALPGISSLQVRTKSRSGERSTTSVMLASRDLPLLARTVMVRPTSSWGRASGLGPA